jgi:hypothetical protein
MWVLSTIVPSSRLRQYWKPPGPGSSFGRRVAISSTPASHGVRERTTRRKNAEVRDAGSDVK